MKYRKTVNPFIGVACRSKVPEKAYQSTTFIFKNACMILLPAGIAAVISGWSRL